MHSPGFRKNLVMAMNSCSRDLMLAQAPPDESKPLFLQYASLEEQHGLARSAMEVYDKAVKTVPVKERLSVYELYLARAHEYFGLGKVTLLYGHQLLVTWSRPCLGVLHRAVGYS